MLYSWQRKVVLVVEKKSKNEVLFDINKNHNWSWIREIYERNKNNMNKVALLYRGNKITYREMFKNAVTYAKSLKTLGFSKGSEIPMCVANCPEFVYLLCAASMIGAKVNLFNENFDPEYINEILKECDSKYLFASDDKYEKIAPFVKDSVCKNKIVFSLNDSLPNNRDPFEEFDKPFLSFKNRIEEFKSNDSNVLSASEFKTIGSQYKGKICDDTVKLDDEFTTTYSSGTTNSSRPKGIVHTNRSYITMGRYHDADVSGLLSMKDMTVLASIPTLSNTNLASNISDTLMQKCTIALEPIYHQDFFIPSLLINKPNVVVTSKSFILNSFKKISKDLNLKLPFLAGLFAAGEPTSKGEEKFINRKLKQFSAGTDVLPKPIAPIPLSIAGGDCEHGGFYINFYKKYNDLLPAYLFRNEESGVKPFDMVETAILDNNGNYCLPYQVGLLVANSDCTMKCYRNNPSGTSNFFIKDAYGKEWGSCGVYAYKDVLGRLHIKGRIYLHDNSIEPYIISDIISSDTKSILSCEVVPVEDERGYVYVAHIEFQPSCNKKTELIINSVEKHLKRILPKHVVDNICYRVHSFDEPFPLTNCGKRNSLELMSEGLENCVKPIVEDNEVKLREYGSTKKIVLK